LKNWTAFREGTPRVVPVVFVFLAFLLLPSPARVAPPLEPVLYADHHAVYWIDSGSHTTTQTIPLSDEATALAIDPIDKSLWVLAHKHLFKFDAQTSLVFELDLESFGPESAIGGLSDPEFLG
jgi:DNA-binding beta-propeller fold protein YncE